MTYFRPHLERYPLPEGWRQERMKHCICAMTSGSRPSGGSDSDAGGVFSLGGEHIDDFGGFRFDNMTFVPRSHFDAIRDDAEVKQDDILLNKDGAKTGKVAYVDDGFPFAEACINEHVFRIRSDTAKLANRNLFYFLLSPVGQAQLSKYIQGSAQPGINQRFPKFLWVRYPADPAEQTRIAETLKAADDHIRALEDQIRKAERVKKALLQEVFGNLIHSRHLKGRECFTAHGSSGFDEHVHVADTPNEGIPYFKVDDFNSPGNERYLQQASTSVVVTPESKCVPYAAGGVVFAKRGAALTKNRVRINATPCFIDPNLMLLRPVPGVVESEFLRYYLMHFRLEKLGEDAGIPQLNNKDLYPKLFPVPDDKAIRENIVKKLNAAEGLVDACNAQLAAARRVKQSLLQNLLAGRIRLKV